jgi:serine O-acetyltransferase
MRSGTRDARVPSISSIEPDWSREQCGPLEWNPSRQLLRALRAHQEALHQSDVGATLRRKAATLAYRFWSAVCGADIALTTKIGGGLLLPHPQGVVIHPDTQLGPNCMLMQQVTLGVGGRIPGAPRLAGHVDVGAGAKILGGVHIGEHARIGANAVVLSDVPAGCTAVGAPARIVAPNVRTLSPVPVA